MLQLILFALMSDAMMPVRVLVVDDDEVSREVLALLLEGEGHAVETADSGDAALARLKDVAGALPGLVLADMQMPGTAGGELAQQMRRVCGAGTMLLAMSGSQPEDEAKRGFDGFLLKPFSMEQLAAVVAGGSVPAVRDETAGILNEPVYEKLAGSMRGAQLEQLYAMCLDDAKRRIAKMRQAASKQDDRAYKSEAHAIRGGCGMVGATELQTIATAMETNGIEATNHVASLDEFLLACERLRRILVARNRREK